ncbi:hypothetical protein BS78_09G109800 [Paspalum vaginatum]|nr:hypothetical protein BS78_09G109800 [Paspalum vaginatum]
MRPAHRGGRRSSRVALGRRARGHVLPVVRPVRPRRGPRLRASRGGGIRSTVDPVHLVGDALLRGSGGPNWRLFQEPEGLLSTVHWLPPLQRMPCCTPIRWRRSGRAPRGQRRLGGRVDKGIAARRRSPLPPVCLALGALLASSSLAPPSALGSAAAVATTGLPRRLPKTARPQRAGFACASHRRTPRPARPRCTGSLHASCPQAPGPTRSWMLLLCIW